MSLRAAKNYVYILNCLAKQWSQSEFESVVLTDHNINDYMIL